MRGRDYVTMAEKIMDQLYDGAATNYELSLLLGAKENTVAATVSILTRKGLVEAAAYLPIPCGRHKRLNSLVRTKRAA
jgi:hypothetical protein